MTTLSPFQSKGAALLRTGIRVTSSTQESILNLNLTRFAKAKHVAGAVIVSSVTLLTACSDDRPTRVPIDSELAISPTETTWDVFDRRDANGNCFIDPNFYVDTPMLITLRDGGGVPVGDVDVRVFVDLAENTFSGYPALELYEDLNSNGVVDGEHELVSGEGDDIARVRLGKYSGEHLLLLRTNLSCAFRSEIFAYVDSYSAQTSVEVKFEKVEDRPEEVVDEPAPVE